LYARHRSHATQHLQAREIFPIVLSYAVAESSETIIAVSINFVTLDEMKVPFKFEAAASECVGSHMSH
jgi:hypothetical protein